METKEIEALVSYARDHPKLVKISEHDDFPLIKLSYTHQCANEREWNEFTIASRGIIINTEDMELVAQPFDKFFNLGEMLQLDQLPDEEYVVQEKYDGVLIIPYEYDGKYYFSTRGSFDNEFIDVAEERFLTNRMRRWLHDNEAWTFMFELIHPKSKILTDYKGRESLVLLGARHYWEGYLMDDADLKEKAAEGVLEVRETWKTINLDHMEQLKETETEQLYEGVVIQFESGLLIKVKRHDYVRVSAAIRKVSTKNIIGLLTEQKFGAWRDELPEEIQTMADEIAHVIEMTYIEIDSKIKDAWEDVKDLQGDRKDFATAVFQDHSKWQTFMFALRDEKDLAPFIWKHIKRNHQELIV